MCYDNLKLNNIKLLFKDIGNIFYERYGNVPNFFTITLALNKNEC
jgi:hypothetical protein